MLWVFTIVIILMCYKVPNTIEDLRVEERSKRELKAGASFTRKEDNHGY